MSLSDMWDINRFDDDDDDDDIFVITFYFFSFFSYFHHLPNFVCLSSFGAVPGYSLL
jgi:hypothetical protein